MEVQMFDATLAFSSFSVDSLDKAKEFYGDTLGLEVTQDAMGLTLHLKSGATVFMYEKENHEPATFTILNFPVEDIDQAVADLKAKGVTFEQYTGHMQTDKNDILRSDSPEHGPSIAWFKDPAGNFLSVLQN